MHTHTHTHTHTHAHTHTHTHIHTHNMCTHTKCSYTAPTAYSVVAFSPIEMLFLNSIVIAPMFLFPVHPIPYMTNVVYVYYFGVMDHSGIKMESIYPWQPNTSFHDEHHRSVFHFLGYIQSYFGLNYCFLSATAWYVATIHDWVQWLPQCHTTLSCT